MSIFDFLKRSKNENAGFEVRIIDPFPAALSDKPLYLSAVFACVRVLSETVASLPLFLYRKLEGGGKEKAQEEKLFYLLHDSPNPEMTSFEFREMLMGHLLLRGNFYAEIVTDKNGQVIELWPLNPDRMEVFRKNGELKYIYQLPDGEKTELSKLQILHIKTFSPDGMKGISILEAAKNAIELAASAEKFGASFFQNSARPSGILKYPRKLSDQALENIRKSFEASYSGLSKAHRIMILEEGLSWEQIGIAPEAAQFLETRKFQVEEIARIFRVPPHLIGHLERSTYSNIEQQSIEFVVHTVRPWLVRIEQALNNQLLTEAEKRMGYFFEHKVDGLLRGDIESRYRAYAVARQNGWMSANEIRELENLNPLPPHIGDVYYIPLNMIAEQKSQAVEAEQRSTLKSKKSVVAFKEKSLRAIRPAFLDVFERILRKEKNDILAEARKLYRKGVTSIEIKPFIEQYYRKHAVFMSKALEKTLELVAAQAEVAVEYELDMTSEVPASAFNDVKKELVNKHIAYSQYRLGEALRKAEEAGKDKFRAIEEEVEEWDTERAEIEAQDASTFSFNYFNLAIYSALPVASLVWKTTSSEACPICDELDGKKISKGSNFIVPGDQFEGEHSIFRAQEPKLVPPLHRGCQCIITSEVI